MADTNIFQRDVELGGVFAIDKAVVSFSGGGSDTDLGGMLVRTVNINYSEPVNMIRTLTGKKIYFVVGTPVGRAQFVGALADPATLQSFFQNYGNACQANNVIAIKSHLGKCSDEKDLTINLKNCICTTFGASVTSEDLMLITQIELMFLQLSI